jgi:lambda repressor-like predicted transcriptional regulator
MSIRKNIIDNSPTDAAQRAAWVIYMLKGKGKSLASIARELSCHRNAVRQALYQPSLRQEVAIAAALGLDVQALFPERYLNDGTRKHSVRVPIGDDTRPGAGHNVEGAEAA